MRTGLTVGMIVGSIAIVGGAVNARNSLGRRQSMRTGLAVGMIVGSIATFGADSDAGEHSMDFARPPRISVAQRATEAVKMRRSRGYLPVLTVVRLAEISHAVHERRRETMSDDAVEHVRSRWEGAVSWTYRRTALQVELAETRRRIRELEGQIDEVDAEVQRLRTEIIDIERRIRLRTRRIPAGPLRARTTL